MKKLLILIPVLFVFFLSACSLPKDNGNEAKEDVVNQPNQTNTVENNSTSSSLKVNVSVYSEKLGIKVSYYSNPEYKTDSKVEGNRLYFFMDKPNQVNGYKTGQYLEGFAKTASTSLPSAIENKFLKNINQSKCFVTITEDTAAYQKAIIDYPDTLCPDGSPAFTCNVCPANYSKTNGIAYFIYYKDHPSQFFYFSIGQYSLLYGAPGATSSLEWFNNVEFIK